MKTKILIIVTITSLLMTTCLYAQQGVAINTTGAAPAASAMLDVSSNSKGMLIPRLDNGQMSGMSNPAVGLLVFNTDYNCFFFRGPSGWQKIINESNANMISDGDGDSYLTFLYDPTDDDTLRIFFNGLEKYKITSRAIEMLNNSNSVLIGKGAGQNMDLSEDKHNIYIGYNAGATNQWAGANTGIGYYALSASTGSLNTAIGSSALKFNTNGNYNTAIGATSQWMGTTGSHNTSMGHATLMFAKGSWNVAVGSGALGSDSTGSGNTAMGFNSMMASRSSQFNTAVGGYTMQSNKNGTWNVAVGYQSMTSDTSGINNVAVGGSSLVSNKNGSRNTVIGKDAAWNNTTGNSNVAAGYGALYSSSFRSNLVAVGDSALYNNGFGVAESNPFYAKQNVAVGSKAMFANTQGHENTAIGYEAMMNNTSGWENTALGCWALKSNTEGTYNSAVGYRSLINNITGSGNNAFGYYSMNSNTGGSWNIALGHSALASNVNGNFNTAVGNVSLVLNKGSYNTGIGYYALASNKANSRSTAIGHQAMQFADNRTAGRETFNTAVGYEALKGSGDTISNTGRYNTAVGDQAIAVNTSGHSNSATGYQALYSNTTGYFNTAAGYQCLGSNTGGNHNTAIGSRAGYAVSSGDSNILVGYHAGKNLTTGSNNIIIGNDIEAPVAGGNNQVVIGAQNLLYGNLATRRIGIGTASPAAQLHTHGTGTGEGNVLFSGTYKSSSPGDPAASGAGTRMMWYPDKAAFRAGYVTGNHWDKDSIGDYSVAMGTDTKAIGDRSIAMGRSITAPSGYEMAFGRYNTLYTPNSTIGWDENDRLFVIGNGTISVRNNAITVLKNGKVGIGNAASEPNYLLSLGDNTNGIDWPASNTLSFHTSGSERMRVGSNGNVSIGSTSTGNNRLKVASAASGGTNATGFFENTDASGLALRAETNSSDGTLLSIQEGSGYSLRCDGYDPNWFVAMIVKGRQVGINTSSPTQNLDVAGNARFRSIGSGSYLGPVNRTSDGTLTTATSDIRLKTNVQTLQGSLDKVQQLRGVSFTWIDDPGLGSRIGMIAQEVQKVCPELVFTNETDGYMGINYAEMSAVLIEAVKEQQAMIEELKKEIEELKARE